MLELHLGQKTVISFEGVKSPILVLGRPGQGKSILILQICLELIRNQQTGLFYDPYGDLTEKIQASVASEEGRELLISCSQDEFAQQGLSKLSKHFVVVHGNYIVDGAAETKQKARLVISQALEKLTNSQWLLVDEAFSLEDEQLFVELIKNDQSAPYRILSANSLLGLSAKDRQRLMNTVRHWFVYKVQNIDAQFLEQGNGQFNSKDIAAIQQYQYQALLEGKMSYDSAPWPIQLV